MKSIKKSGIALWLSVMLCTTAASANNLANSEIGRGIRQLILDISGFLVILSPLAGAAAAGYFILRRSTADEQDGKMWTNRAKIAVFCGVGGMMGSVLVNLLSSYF